MDYVAPYTSKITSSNMGKSRVINNSQCISRQSVIVDVGKDGIGYPRFIASGLFRNYILSVNNGVESFFEV